MEKLKKLLKALFEGDVEKQKKIDDIVDDINIDDFDKSKKSKSDDSNPNNSNLTQNQLEELKNLIKTKDAKIDKLYEELESRIKKDKEREETLNKEQEKERKKKIEDLLNDAITKGKIAPKDDETKQTYQKILETDYETGKKLIDKIEVKNAKAETPKNTTNQPVKSVFGSVSPAFMQKIENDLKNK